MKLIKGLFKILGMSCMVNDHQWIEYTDCLICKNCPAAIVKNSAKKKLLTPVNDREV